MSQKTITDFSVEGSREGLLESALPAAPALGLRKDAEKPGEKARETMATGGLHGEIRVAVPERLPGENDQNYRRFLRYIQQGQGMTQEQLTELLGVPQPTVSRLMRKFAWRARAEKFALTADRAGSTESVQWAERHGELREREWALHLELISAGIEALKRWRESSKIPNAGEIAKLIELGARLGRLAAGLPLGATEVTGSTVSPVRVELEVALEKVYGRVEKQVVEVEGVRAVEG